MHTLAPSRGGNKYKKKKKCGLVAKVRGVTKNKHDHNQNMASENESGASIGYEPTLICFGSNILKIVAMPVFFRHRIFRIFSNEGQPRPPAGLHNLFHPTIRDGSTWSMFGARGKHGDVFLFSNLGAL